MGDLFLSDDPPPRRPRPRWVDGLGLGAVVLGIVAIGVLGDRGTPGRNPAPTTTTTTSTTSPFRRGRPFGRTTTTAALPTTTTLFEQLASAGIPFPTRSIVLLSSGGTPLLVDVDRATVTRVPVSTASGILGVEEGFVLPDGNQFQLLPSQGLPVRTVEVEVGLLQGGVLRGGPGTFWSVTAPELGATRAVELDTSGRRTGRHVELPSGAYVAGVVDAGVVAGAHGSLTFVDGTTGRLRSLGTGDLLAVGGHSIVRQSCELLACRVQLVDIRTGRTRTLPDVVPGNAYLQLGKFSSDSEWVALSFGDSSGQLRLTVLHLDDGRTWTAEVTGVGPFEFSPSGNVLFVADGTELCAYETATGTRHCLPVAPANVQSLAVAPSP